MIPYALQVLLAAILLLIIVWVMVNLFPPNCTEAAYGAHVVSVQVYAIAEPGHHAPEPSKYLR